MKIMTNMWKSWLVHFAVSGLIVLVFGSTGQWLEGAKVATYVYLGREYTNLESEYQSGGVSEMQWVDHIGDMAGPVFWLVLMLFFG